MLRGTDHYLKSQVKGVEQGEQTCPKVYTWTVAELVPAPRSLDSLPKTHTATVRSLWTRIKRGNSEHLEVLQPLLLSRRPLLRPVPPWCAELLSGTDTWEQWIWRKVSLPGLWADGGLIKWAQYCTRHITCDVAFNPPDSSERQVLPSHIQWGETINGRHGARRYSNTSV